MARVKNNKGKEAEISVRPEATSTTIVPFKKDDVERVKEYYRLFEETKTALLNEEDIINLPFKTNDGKTQYRTYIKKTGWWKIKTLLNISIQIFSSQRISEENKIVYIYKVKASTPTGLSSEAEGVCSSDEPNKKGKPEFVLSGTAQTRAINRAISWLIGGAELSAEEVEGIDVSESEKEEIPAFKSGLASEEELEEPIEEITNEEKAEETTDEDVYMGRADEDMATEKQINLLERLQKEGRLSSKINIYSLTKRQASTLIEKAIKNR